VVHHECANDDLDKFTHLVLIIAFVESINDNDSSIEFYRTCKRAGGPAHCSSGSCHCLEPESTQLKQSQNLGMSWQDTDNEKDSVEILRRDARVDTGRETGEKQKLS
jgi:hypothetical protein